MKTEEKIKQLRLERKSYNEISKILGLAKATISYHCIKLGLNTPVKGKILSSDEIIEMKEYYKSHTIKETSKYFNSSQTTVKYYVDKKRILYTEEENKKRNYNRIKTRRQKLKEKGVEYLGGKCMTCGYNKCIWALQFHHRNPEEKEFNISENSTFSWNKIVKELDKCDLLCSTCHDELHYNEYVSASIPSV